MCCLLSLQLTVALAEYCPGVQEQDAIQAVDWMVHVLRNLLDQRTVQRGGALASPEGVREWIDDSGVWHRLLRRAGCKTQHHLSHVFVVLLSNKAFTPRELVDALLAAGAIGKSDVPTSSRLAMHGALLGATRTLGGDFADGICSALCNSINFEHLDEESVDLLIQISRCVNVRAGVDSKSDRYLGVPRCLLQYLTWGVGQDESPARVLEYTRREFLQSLVPQGALAALLPAIAAEALSLALHATPGEPVAATKRRVRLLCGLAVDVSRLGAASCRDSDFPKASTAALATLCGALPPVGAAVFLQGAEAEDWIAPFVDALVCYLRQPGAQIATTQVGTLWSRMIVRPILGLPVASAAMQYFKLALLAQPQPSSALLAPLHLAPNPPPEVRLAYASIFCPSSFEDDPPPISSEYFLPDVNGVGVTELSSVVADPSAGLVPPSYMESSPPRFPPVLQRSLSSTGALVEVLSTDPPLIDRNSITSAAAGLGAELPPISTAAPRLRLEHVRGVSAGQHAELFGELTVYDAMERRLWDEFDARGHVEDGDALQQRDAAAARCLDMLDREVRSSGVEQLPTPLAEAHAKFSFVCNILAQDGLTRTRRELLQHEDAFAEAEEELLAAQAALARAKVRRRRRGGSAAEEDGRQEEAAAVEAARQRFSLAHVTLVATLRQLATQAQLGLVEVIGSPGLLRALRAVGDSHGDPLLDRVWCHRPWIQAQSDAESERPLDDNGRGTAGAAKARTTPQGALDVAVAEGLVADAWKRFARPKGLGGYADVLTISTSGFGCSVLSARSVGARRVALKAWDASAGALCQRELRALAALRDVAGVCALPLLGLFRGSDGRTYFELPWCPGGTLQQWCQNHPGVIGGADVGAVVQCLGFFRQALQALQHLHGPCAAVHGDVALANLLLTADHRLLLCDFKRCLLRGEEDAGAFSLPPPTPGYAAPEQEAAGSIRGMAPSRAADVFAAGVAMARAFLDPALEVARYPVHPARGLRGLPEEGCDADLADLLQALLSDEPGARPTAAEASCHRGLDPTRLLRRRGLLAGGDQENRFAPCEHLIRSAEMLREEFRSKRVDEPLMFAREAVFEAISKSRVGEWTEDALLGEWRVMLDDESGVDGGGLRREVVSLFFEQLETSKLVVRVGADGPGVAPALFVGERQRADVGPQQWRQMWSSIGAMVLRSIVHFGNAPAFFSSFVFDCAFGRIGRLPPDDGEDGEDLAAGAGAARLASLREARGDEWARSELLDWLRRLRRVDAAKEAGYRWMLAQRSCASRPADGAVDAGGGSVYVIPAGALQTIDAMLEAASYHFLMQNSSLSADGSVEHVGAVLEWTLVWDIYLKYLGSGDRWIAYEAFAAGLTARGRRRELWAALTGDQIVAALEGAALSPELVAANLEFKPSYGYDAQINLFHRVLKAFSPEELSMFLRFATGIGKLPATKHFPNGQKLTIRFLPEQLDRLPSAHTCFWVVDLPPYEDEDDLAVKLRQAIAAPQPFALS
eukprot:TRINITY_DN37987_c0_g1_i1.p1 TRINITY_DN37987_c0_g1~~TRINITY_DN37987_c0_g1_i1.p1  ORF type:complete len:1562 (-),score=385.27 TRINITY_DN37987_c0_g1_i1:128-4624(-)